MKEKILTVKEWKEILNQYPDNSKVFIDGRTEFLSSDIDAQYTVVKLYEEGYYGVENNDGNGKPFKALVLRL